MYSDLRKYRGRLSFLPIKPYEPPQPLRRQSLNYDSSSSANVQPHSMRRSQSELAEVNTSDLHPSANRAPRGSVHGAITEEENTERNGEGIEEDLQRVSVNGNNGAGESASSGDHSDSNS